MSTNVGARIKARREALGYSQAELAKRCGWPTASRLGNYELEHRRLSAEDAAVLANVLKVSPGFLLYGEDEAFIFKEQKYAVLSAAQLLDTNRERVFREKLQNSLSTSIEAGQHAFWYEVSGHSMTAPQGMKPSFPEGIMVLCDPDVKPETGDFCLVKMPAEHEIAFKRYIREDGKNWLEPLNPAIRYQPFELDDSHEVIGKILSAVWPQTHFV